MITRQKELVLSPYMELYDLLVGKDRFLRRFHDEVDFSFVFDELYPRYCPDNGRKAIDPVMLFKMLVIKELRSLSDSDLMDEINVNLEYKYFLDMAPEQLAPDPSTLCVFRRQRLKDIDLMDTLLSRTLQLAMDQGILKRSVADGKVHVTAIIDGTHTESLHGICRPVPYLKELTAKVRSALYDCEPSFRGNIEKDDKVGGTDLTAEIGYGFRLIAFIERSYPGYSAVKRLAHRVNYLREQLEDIVQYYSFSPGDPDARVGHKSADTSFFGYKSQIVMDEDSRLILDAEVTSGEVGDALPGRKVLERVADNVNLHVDEVLGDTAYSGQPFLELAEEKSFTLMAPPHPNLGSGIDGRDGFYFNKDADMFCCPMGHMAVSKRTATYKKDNGRTSVIYSFDPDKCCVCPLKATCIKGKAGYRTFSVTRLTAEQKKLLRQKNTEYFSSRIRQRYKIEQKNAHLKQSYGMRKCIGKGINMMTVQAAVAFFTSNIKIILDKKV